MLVKGSLFIYLRNVMLKKYSKKAFTLVEMLIVVIIIGILASALLPKLKGAQQRARDTARKANLSQISTALEMYQNDEWVYPSWSCLSDIKKDLVPTYIGSLPKDPQAGRMTYWTKTDGWCSWGVYAYTNMKRSGWESAAAVLVANVEAAGRVWNYVLPKVTNHATFVSSTEDWGNKRANVAVNSDTNLTEFALQENDVFESADVAENAMCASVTITWWNSSSQWCWSPSNHTAGQAAGNNYMVYVVFN